MGYLLILFVVLIILSILGTILLIFAKSPKTRTYAFYFLVLWSILITVISATSLPSNFVVSRVMAWAIGFIAIIAAGIKIKSHTFQMQNIANTLVIFSVLAGLIKLLFL